MTSRVSSKNKDKKAKRKNSVKKKRQTEKKRYKETASPGVETGLSARASNSLTTALQRHTWFEKVNFVK